MVLLWSPPQLHAYYYVANETIMHGLSIHNTWISRKTAWSLAMKSSYDIEESLSNLDVFMAQL